MIISLLIYNFICFVVFIISTKCYKESIITGFTSKKISYLGIIIISLLCAIYNYYLTVNGTNGHDRVNYLYDFETGRYNSSGLTVLMALFNIYDLDFNFLLYFTTFFSVFIALIAYKLSRDASPYSLLAFFYTSFLLSSMTVLKQTYASSFSILAIILLIQRDNKVQEIAALLLMLLACLFHPSGYMLLPVYFLFKIKLRIKTKHGLVLLLIIFTFLLKDIILFVADLLNSVVPFLSSKIYEYFRDDVHEYNSNMIIGFKGLPYYYITYLAIKYRDFLVFKIKNFDKYFLISCICSLCYLISFYDRWMIRLVDLIAFPCLIFFGLISQYIPRKKESRRIVLFLLALFTLRELIVSYINYGSQI